MLTFNPLKAPVRQDMVQSMSWTLTSQIILSWWNGDFSFLPNLAFRKIKARSLEFPLEANIYTCNFKSTAS